MLLCIISACEAPQNDVVLKTLRFWVYNSYLKKARFGWSDILITKKKIFKILLHLQIMKIRNKNLHVKQKKKPCKSNFKMSYDQVTVPCLSFSFLITGTTRNDQKKWLLLSISWLVDSSNGIAWCNNSWICSSSGMNSIADYWFL